MCDPIHTSQRPHAIYVNGMLSTVGAANRVITKVPGCTHFHNYATEMKDILSLSFSLIASLSCFLSGRPYYTWMGSLFLLGGYARWEKVEMRKTTLSIKLFHQMNLILREKESNRLLLILHSEGAEIGRLALSRLLKDKDRIRVIVLGGKEGLPHEWNAMHFNHKKDMIAALSQMIYPSPSQVHQLEGPCKGMMDCHRAIRYIKDMQVRNALERF